MVPLIRSRQLVTVAPVDAAKVEGLTGHARVFGICTEVEGVARPGTTGKTLTQRR